MVHTSAANGQSTEASPPLDSAVPVGVSFHCRSCPLVMCWCVALYPLTSAPSNDGQGY